MPKRAKYIFFFFLVILLSLRIFSDHTQNYHYSGDFLAEKKLLITSAENFEKIGFFALRFMPNFKEIQNPKEETYETLQPHFYTHYPALPYWIYGGTYLLFDHSEIAARVLAVIISLLGLYFAFQSALMIVKLITPNFQNENNYVPHLIALSILALNPGFLFFSDNIQHQSMIDCLLWASLYWSLRYLFFGASLGWGLLLYFLHVWISFEWLIPIFFITLFCIWKREKTPQKFLKSAILFLLIGFCLPIGLRIAHNAWALGGVHVALSDFITRAKVRSLGEEGSITMQYSLIKHTGKLFFGGLWFVGVTLLLLVMICLKDLWRAFTSNRQLAIFFLLWAFGSVSWQFLMPQNAMHHAYSQIYIANFLILTAALCVILFWEKRRLLFIALLIPFYIGCGGAIQTEITNPFLSGTTKTLAKFVCKSDRQKLARKFSSIKSSMVTLIGEKFDNEPAPAECGFKSRLSVDLLKTYAFAVKNKLNPP